MDSEKEALLDFCNTLEAACVTLRRNLGNNTAPVAGSTPRQWPWDPTKISWIPKTGDKGPYEKASDQNNVDFQKMASDLTDHQGKLNRDGKFYWLFLQSGDVGRKEVK